MKTRDEIIYSMCLTYRHDYGIDLDTVSMQTPGTVVGMTKEYKKHIWKIMAMIFDNDIAPYMEFKQ